jgi:hypothetical protein
VLKIIEPRPELLRRLSWVTQVVDHDPKLNAHGRAHALSLLPADLRERAETTLLESARDELDLSFFDNPNLLALIAPLKLIELGVSLRSEMLGQLEERIDKLVDEAELDDDADSHFEKMTAALDRLENMGMDDDGVDLMETARSQVKTSIERLEQRKRERDEESDDDADWTHIISKAEPTAKVTESTTSTRSLFSDVDK